MWLVTGKTSEGVCDRSGDVMVCDTWQQEFRELELLDDITDKHYRGKTALLLDDDTRNSLIKA